MILILKKKTIFFPVTKNNESRYVTISNKTKNLIVELIKETSNMNENYLFISVNGGKIRVLQKILGHKKLSTTEIYAHVSENLMSIQKENYSPINQILKGDKKYIRARSKRLK